ncbi:hypothetical protein BKP43_48210 [Variovorax boronicumulans]|uniref:hypothetical protein n=1 Tax=Variovorax boronicumulans TaxID=436515 RepID=UPI00117CB242|nr:hypothetical protein [Variovorax boronicumulans]PBI85548.1 hypothetical protein BKP43_48210 [Variovorax boronicumulans]
MDVVSVSEIVESIAEHVPNEWSGEGPLAPADIVVQMPLRPGIDAETQRRMEERLRPLKVVPLNRLFQMAFRESRAAAALDQYLHNAHATGSGPRWFDWGETGRPKISDAARSEALDMLVHMSRWIHRYEKAFRAGQFDEWPQVNKVPRRDGKYEHEGDSDRLRNIGFDRTEIIRFLKSHGIPHSLGGASLPTEEPLLLESPVAEKESEVKENKPEVSSVSNTLTEGLPPRKKITPIFVKKPDLSAVVARARAQALDPHSASSVFLVLQEMAEGADPPRPLLGLVPKKGIKYRNGDDFGHLSLDALRKQLAREAQLLSESTESQQDMPAA